jgi:hypothetical protein
MEVQMQQWKLDRIAAIADEVRELHPVLRQIFSADRSITSFEYTHGNTEMGADFVLARPDPTLGEEQYVGVIAKCGGIKQNFDDLRRQIEECKVERHFAGGKKKIHLTEIWIVTNGSISSGAERKIYEDYKSRNVRFIDGDKLAQLVDRHANHFWDMVPEVLASYLRVTHAQLSDSERQFSLLPGVSVNQYIEQELIALEAANSLKPGYRRRARNRIKLIDAIHQEEVILVEGGMGAGKSSLFRRTSISLCTVEDFGKHKMVPRIINISELGNDPDAAIAKIFADMDAAANEFPDPVTNLLFVDAVDEIDCENGDRLTLLRSISALAHLKTNVRVIFGCRAIWTVDEKIELDKFLKRFAICAVTPAQMVKFLGEVCKAISLTSRFTDELTRSNLFRVLPKTPMSTVLLAKIMNAGLRELPQTLPELYSKYTELALGRWDANKGLSAEKEYPLLSNLIQQLSEYMLDNGLTSLSLDEVRDRFEGYLRAREDVPPVDEVLSTLSQRTELIAISADENVFRFRHKTFLEFFYAAQLKERMGKSAPFRNPFDGYWLGVEYFYLGLIQDAGERIEKLSSIVITEERSLFLKLLNLGNLLLAAHRTEYAYVERGLYRLFIEVAEHFVGVANGSKKSVLGVTPKLQFLGLLSMNLRYVLGFDFFRKALDTVSLQLECDLDIGCDQQVVASFLVDSVRASLGEKDAFKFLIEKNSSELDWVIRLGIHHVAQDENLKTDALERFEKKMNKMRKGNKPLNEFILDLYDTSMIDLRKRLSKT